MVWCGVWFLRAGVARESRCGAWFGVWEIRCAVSEQVWCVGGAQRLVCGVWQARAGLVGVGAGLVHESRCGVGR